LVFFLAPVFGHERAALNILLPASLAKTSDDRYLRDATRGVIDTPELKLFGGMHGARWYANLSDLGRMGPARQGWLASLVLVSPFWPKEDIGHCAANVRFWQ
jgi:hypothetical protein